MFQGVYMSVSPSRCKGVQPGQSFRTLIEEDAGISVGKVLGGLVFELEVGFIAIQILTIWNISYIKLQLPIDTYQVLIIQMHRQLLLSNRMEPISSSIPSSQPSISLINQNPLQNLSKYRINFQSSPSPTPVTQQKLKQLQKLLTFMKQKQAQSHQKEERLRCLQRQKKELLKELEDLDRVSKIRGINMSQKYLENLYYLNENSKVINQLEEEIKTRNAQSENRLSQQQGEIDQLIKEVSRLKIEHKKNMESMTHPRTVNAQYQQLMAHYHNQQQRNESILKEKESQLAQQQAGIREQRKIQHMKVQHERLEHQLNRMLEEFSHTKNEILSTLRNKRLQESARFNTSPGTLTQKEKESRLSQLIKDLKERTEEYIIDDKQIKELRQSVWEQNNILKDIIERDRVGELGRMIGEVEQNIGVLREAERQHAEREAELRISVQANTKVNEQLRLKVEAQPQLNLSESNVSSLHIKEQLKQLTIKCIDEQQRVKQLGQFEGSIVSLKRWNSDLEEAIGNIDYKEIESKKQEIDEYKAEIEGLEREMMRLYHDQDLGGRVREKLGTLDYRLDFRACLLSVVLLLALIYF